MSIPPEQLKKLEKYTESANKVAEELNERMGKKKNFTVTEGALAAFLLWNHFMKNYPEICQHILHLKKYMVEVPDEEAEKKP